MRGNCRRSLAAFLGAFACGSAFAIMPEVIGFRAPVATPKEVVKGFVWVEAEGFADYGQWRLDTQFVHKMGSGYLLAAGVLKPLGQAKTKVALPSAGAWTVWARTKDWLPEFHPGTFRVLVNGQAGVTLGRSGKDGWRWEKAGVWTLSAGAADLALEDLSGAFARCDALLFTTDAAYVPPDEDEACAAARAKFTGADVRVRDGGSYEFVVVGSGPGGISAAIAAARRGVKTALVHDRPVLGGNASCELGVPTDGAAISHRNAREGGICEEANLARVGTKERTFSAVFREMAKKLPSLSVFSNQRVMKVDKDGAKIAAVIARDTLTGAWTRFGGKLFLDGTGDGWIGCFAGAELLYGREGKDKYDEWPAPEKGDEMLMSGCLMGNYLGYCHHAVGKKVPFVVPEWARVLPKGFVRWTRNGDSQWWVEHSGRFNEVTDPERARDELFRINLAYWGWLKNEWERKDTLADHELYEMAHMNGRREGYRILGDYILTGNDCLAGRMFDDRISYGGWPLDRHDPEGMENPTGNGYCPKHPNVPIYSIPFRCLYSKNVPNLTMAGRNVSVSHVALGSVRVEATIMTLGQAVGTAVERMLKKGQLPREYGADAANIRELQQLLLKDDLYIPGLVNEDPLDLARGAKASATSVMKVRVVSDESVARHELSEHRHGLNMPRAAGFARGLADSLEGFSCWLESDAEAPVEVKAVVFAAKDRSGRPASMTKAGEVTAVVKKGSRGFVDFRPSAPIPLEGDFVWVQLQPEKEISWRLMTRANSSGFARAYGAGAGWKTIEGERYACVPAGGFREVVDTKPDYVVDGVSRQVEACTHGWFSDPAAKLPQALTLDFGKPTRVGEVRLTFDSDLNPLHPPAHPATLARKYRLEGLADGQWTTLAEVDENLLRHRIHAFAAKDLSALRVTVFSTWGDPSARIFEIRAYAGR